MYKTMNLKNITLLGLFVVFLYSCYEDKGNYDYKELNDFQLKFTPAPPSETFVYLLNQPSGDTLLYTISAEIKQTVTQGQDNLEFLWTSTHGDVTDSVYSKDITLRIPPNEKSVFNLMCKVRDKNLNIEYYQNATVKTEIPFHDSWFLLHGDMGSRKIGAIQWDGEGNSRWDNDIMTVSKRPQIKNATDIAYGTMGTSIPGDFLRNERLLISVGSDSIVSFLPFDLQPAETPWNIVRPVNVTNVDIASMKAHGQKEYVGILDKDGKFYWARTGHFIYAARSQNIHNNYHIDNYYINQEGIVTLWDNSAKKFMYYKMGNSSYDPWNGTNRQDDTNDTEMVYYEDIGTDEMTDKIVLWAGRGTQTTKSIENSLFVVKDEVTQKCYLYNFVFDDGKGGEKKSANLLAKDKDKDKSEYTLMKVKRDSLLNVKFDDNALFATSNAFNEQLFYTDENELYRCVLGTEEVVPLINFDGKIKQMRFRISNEYGIGGEVTSKNLRTIGVVIEGPNGKDLFKEIYLDTAGDIIKISDFNYDYGKIEKIEFTATQRRFDL